MLTTLLALPLCFASPPQGPKFAPPVRVVAADGPVKVEAPGYAAPSLFDVDRDGTKDLVVGQFRGGKMKVYKGLAGGKFGEGKWLEADGVVAEVPGVW